MAYRYRIREELSANGNKSYRPEFGDGENRAPTQTFSLTGQPYFAASYKEALKCIEQHKNPPQTIIHMDPKPEEEKTEDLSEKIYKDLHERDTEHIT